MKELLEVMKKEHDRVDKKRAYDDDGYWFGREQGVLSCIQMIEFYIKTTNKITKGQGMKEILKDLEEEKHNAETETDKSKAGSSREQYWYGKYTGLEFAIVLIKQKNGEV